MGLDMGQALGVQKRDDLVVLVYRRPDHVICFGVMDLTPRQSYAVDGKSRPVQERTVFEAALSKALNLTNSVAVSVMRHRRQIGELYRHSRHGHQSLVCILYIACGYIAARARRSYGEHPIGM